LNRRQLLDAPQRCENCGCPVGPREDSVVKRGALVVTRDPLRISWRGFPVRLSPTETHVMAFIATRGRASWEAIDQAMADFGTSPKNRPVLICRIRRKFADIGAMDPLESVGQDGVRLFVEDDEYGSNATIIGLRRLYGQ
jgi:hypothetical protein